MNKILWCDGLLADDWAVIEAARFQRVAEKNGQGWSLEEAFKKWEELSLDHDAGWMGMPKTDEGLWEMWADFKNEWKQ